MSEEKFEQVEPKDENDDVEAHKRRSHMNDEPAAEESDDSDDVEAHRRRSN